MQVLSAYVCQFRLYILSFVQNVSSHILLHIMWEMNGICWEEISAELVSQESAV